MVSAHTERPALNSWGPNNDTGQWGGLMGGWQVGGERKNKTSSSMNGENAEVCQIFWYVPHTMVLLLLGFLPFSEGTIDFLHDHVVRLPASGRNLSWGAMAAAAAVLPGFFPWTPGLEPLAGFSLRSSPHRVLAHGKLYACFPSLFQPDLDQVMIFWVVFLSNDQFSQEFGLFSNSGCISWASALEKKQSVPLNHCATEK